MEKICKTVKEQLSSYIDGMVNEREAEEISAHLTSCEDCRGEYEFLRGILETAGEMPELSVSAALHERILQGVSAASATKKKPGRPLWKIASGFAAAAAVIAISVISLNSLPGHPELTPDDMTENAAEPYTTQAPPSTATPEEQPAQAARAVNDRKAAQPAAPAQTPAPTAAAEAEQQDVALQNVPEAIATPAPTQAPETAEEPAAAQEDGGVAAQPAPAAYSVAEVPAAEGNEKRMADMAAAPEAAAALTDEDVAAADSAAEANADMTATAARASSGSGASAGGGGGSSSVTTGVAAPTLRYYMTAEGRQEAEQLLAACARDGEVYLIPAEDAESLCTQIEALSGYLRHSGSVTEGAETLRLMLCVE